MLLGGGLLPGRAGFLAVSLAVDALLLALLGREARRTGRWQGAWLWSAAALVAGPVLVGRYDVVPTLLAVAAVMLLSRPSARAGAAGALAGLGAVVKVWPALVLLAVPRRRLPRAAAAAVAAAAAAWLAVGLFWQGSGGFLHQQAGRGLQAESVGAWPLLLARSLGGSERFPQRFGASEVDAAGAGPVALLLTVAAALVLGWLLVMRLTGRLERAVPADVAFTAVLVSLATSRLNSPQFLVWLLGLGSLCLAEPGSRMRLSVWLVAATGPITQVLCPWGYRAMTHGAAWAVGLQGLRVGLLVAATVLALHALVPDRYGRLTRAVPPVAAARPGGLMDPRTTAVVLVEYQNDFTSEGGALHGAVADSMESTGMLKNSAEVLRAAREAGATVIHSPIQFAEGYNEITSHPYGILKGVVDTNAFVKGSWGAEIVEDVKPEEGDIVLEGKRGLDAFASTNLDFILRSKGIQTVALSGFLTNCCVESTMRSAYEKGFEVVTLTDCVGATSAEEHENAIKYDYPMFSKPMTSGEFVEALQGGAASEDTSRGY